MQMESRWRQGVEILLDALCPMIKLFSYIVEKMADWEFI
jgi:hypothetical protein